MGIITDRIELYKRYLRDLEEIQGHPIDADAVDIVSMLHFDPDIIWYPIIKDGEEIGFYVISMRTQCHPDCTYFIGQLYVDKEHRRQGIASREIGGYIDNHAGRYCLDILTENTVAKEFWERIFRERGYEPIQLTDVQRDIGNAKTYYWEAPR